MIVFLRLAPDEHPCTLNGVFLNVKEFLRGVFPYVTIPYRFHDTCLK